MSQQPRRGCHQPGMRQKEPAPCREEELQRNEATEGANPQARGEGSQEPGKAGGAEEHA